MDLPLPAEVGDTFALLAETIRDPVVILSPCFGADGDIVDFTFDYVNAAAESTIGMPREGVVGQRLLAIFPSHVELGLFDPYVQVALTRVPKVIDVPWFEEGNVAGAFEASIAPFGDRLLAVVRDVTARVKVERRAQANEERYRMLLENARDAVFHTRDGIIEWVSPSVTSLLQWQPDELIGRPSWELCHPEDGSFVLDAPTTGDDEEDEDDEKAATIRVRLRRADGSWRWVESSSQAIADAGDPATGSYVCIVRDVHTEVEAQDASARAETRLATILHATRDAVVIVGRDATNRFANAALTRVFGYEPHQIRGSSARDRLHPDDLAEVLGALQEVTAEPGSTVSRQCRFRHRDGHYLPVDIAITNLLDDPEIDGFVISIHDLSQELAARDELAASEARHRSLMRVIPDAVVVIEDLRIAFANEAAATLCGVSSHDELVGLPMSRFQSPTVHQQSMEYGLEFLRTGRVDRPFVAWMHRFDGSPVLVEATPATVPGNDRAVLLLMRDIGERERLLSELAASQATLAQNELRMRSLVESAPIGIFETDEAGGCTYINSRFAQITGTRGLDDVRGFLWIALLHSDDSAAARRMAAAAMRARQPFHCECRYVTPAGRLVWVDIQAVPVIGSDGQLMSYIGTLDDITARRELEHATFEANEMFQSAFNNAPTGMLLSTIEGDTPGIVKVNAAYEAMLGRTASALGDLDIYSITHPDDIEPAKRGRDALLAGAIDSHRMELRHRHADGHWVWCSLTRSIVRDAEGVPRYTIAQLDDITARKQAEEQIRLLAVTDPLTGLSNRRHFLDLLARASTALVRPRQLAVAFVDLDHFKTINDELGHEAGDRLLEEVAVALTNSVRPGDTVARLGGDEFSIVIDDVTPAEVEGIVERLLQRLVIERTLPDGRTHHVTASIGVTISEPDATADPDALLRRADAAMYRAKQLGRNRWVLA